MSTDERQHPEAAPTDPTARDGDQLSADATRRRASAGGYALAAKRTPEERSEAARKAVRARWERENARREEAGLPPTHPTPQLLDPEARAYWLEQVDARFGVDYPWPHKMARARQAVALAREAAARAAAEAFDREGGA